MISTENKTPGRGSGAGAGVFRSANCAVRISDSRRSAQRLPAFGRQLKAALEAGLRPRACGGGVIVTSDWNFARAADPARVVCPPEDPPESYDFRFLAGIEVLVLVPERDEIHGEQLVARIRDAGARLVVMVVDRECSP